MHIRDILNFLDQEMGIFTDSTVIGNAVWKRDRLILVEWNSNTSLTLNGIILSSRGRMSRRQLFVRMVTTIYGSID